jgi:hypothetical protein
VTSLAPSVEWFRFKLPPGTEVVRLPLTGEVTCFVDGVRREVANGEVRLDAGTTTSDCVLRVVSADGRRGGAVWTDLPTAEVGEGRLDVGDWQNVGLGGYSGGVSYRQAVALEVIPDGELVLDLGEVRGTAEVSVNGSRAGARVMSPYRFDVTGLLRNGTNDIDVQVFNTIAPHIAAHSPTLGVVPGQLRSGLFGPVRLLTGQLP